ncbi:hypothetical protein M2325_001648 [Methanococcus voltae PS]|uniref:SGNH/GDSL hydrolase family protein n=1 Tax=Methanococcus voltae PS TaxID=523842 RepID=A0ABT2EY94_METVO|nr:D-alanyl-lipoteichoic acid biosynthesis protein DltD [Methanococcus voltae]MCS3922938.1 hypothetical protein [Methanococcus voltae PS]
MNNLFKKKLIIFVILFMLLLSSLNLMYVSTNGYKSLNNVYKFNNIPHNLELVNFGTSHGMRLYYDNEPYTTFNFALSSQLLYYDYYMLKQYSNYLSDNCVVILPVSYLSLYQNYSEQISLQEPRYYGILNPKYLNHTFEKYIRYELFPVLSSKANIRYIFKDRNSPYQDWEYSNDTMNENDLKNNAKKRINYFFYDEKTINVNPIESQSIIYLKKIIEYCKTHNYKIVLITTPLTDSYHERVPQEVYDEFYKIVPEIAKEYNVTYIDYSNYSKISSNNTLFQDSDHLNLKGRTEFTKILVKDLQNKSILEIK